MAAVQLSGVPVRLYDAWEQHSDALLREYMLGMPSDSRYSHGDIARARAARIMVGELIRGAQREQPHRKDSVDITVTLPDHVTPADFSVLQAILDDAMALARAGEFLTLPSLPELVALRNWVCEEVVNQVAGREPVPWSGEVAAAPEEPFAVWPGVADLPVDAMWLVGDDHNRIVAASEPAADLLRWQDHDLIGQRILAVIPPALRDAHIAGFTHATVSGEHTLLGQPLPVDAWTYDGEAVPITLTLERQSALQGRCVYVAWLGERSAEDAAETTP